MHEKMFHEIFPRALKALTSPYAPPLLQRFTLRARGHVLGRVGREVGNGLEPFPPNFEIAAHVLARLGATAISDVRKQIGDFCGGLL